MWAVIGILATLQARQGDSLPAGRIIDVSLYETALAWLTVPLTDWLTDGKNPPRSGSGSPNIVPYQVFNCLDDAILVAAGNDELYRRLCEVLGLPELAVDPRFVTNGGRVANRHLLIPLLEDRFRQGGATDYLNRLEAASIPCGRLQSMDRVATDAQTLSLDILRKTPDGRATTVALPISFDGARPPIAGNTPALGEHDHLLRPDGADPQEKNT